MYHHVIDNKYHNQLRETGQSFRNLVFKENLGCVIRHLELPSWGQVTTGHLRAVL